MTTRRLGFLATAVLATITTSRAQCSNAWESFGVLPGVNHVVNAVTTWDPDGPGPLRLRVVVGGSFGTAGAVSAAGVAAWDPMTGQWSALGAGIAGTNVGVIVLLALPNGDLIAGGRSNPSGGTAVQPLLRWNGTTWTPFGGLTPGSNVNALARLPNGDLAVGGSFTSAGATALSHVGVWNGTTWSSLGGGTDAPVYGLTVLGNGDLLALGDFTIAGGVPANGVARWNGTAWSALGSGITGTYYGYGPRGETAVVLPNGDLVVGGMFSDAGGAPASHLARWDGTSWSAFGGGIGGTGYAGIGVRSLAVLPSGDLVAGGFFMTAGGLAIPNLARWDGSTWSTFGTGIPSAAVNSLLVLPGGDLFAGGTFTVAGGTGASYVARWDGTAWSSLGDGTAPSARVHSLLTMPDGSFLAGGAFQTAGAVPVPGIARWDGVSWSALGSGFPPYGRVNAMVRLSNGNVLAVGAGFVGRWDGAAWTVLASVFAGAVPHADIVEAVAELPNGDIVIGGDFSLIGSTWILGLARWDGTSWSELGGQQPGEVHALATLDNGDLVVGGDLLFQVPSTNGVARWNGTAWSTFGSGLQSWGSAGVAFAIAPLTNGAFIAGGQFTTAGGLPANNIARWNGAAWSPLGAGTNGTVRTVHVLPNGDVICGGNFSQAGGVAVSGIARWNGSAWTAVAAGTPAFPVRAVTALPNGELMVGGEFTALGGQVSPYLTRLVTTCPAAVQSTGAGCAGDTLTATLPWTGGMWRSDASNLPPAALVAAVSGFATTTLPLVAVFSTALPGCTLHVQPDLVDLVTGAGGVASLQFVIPNTPSLAGITFHHQMVPIALDATLAVSATNALQLTVGSF